MGNGESVDLISTTRLHPIFYTIITNKYSTLSELKQLDIDSVLDLYEACVVNAYNRSQMLKGVNNG